MMETKLDKGYTENLPLWAQVRAAIRGKQGAIKLLDSEHGYFGLVAPSYRITNDNYDAVSKRRLAYFARGRFFNATGRTHDAYVGMIGAKPVDIEASDSMEAFIDDVDGEGATMMDFALEIASEVLVTARYGVLVDPPNNEGRTQSNMDQSRLVGYRAEAIPNHVVSGGKLTLVDLIELYWEKNGDEYEQKEQLRRLELINGVYTSRIKREGEWMDVVEPKIDNKTLDYIPFQFIGSENNKPTYDRPVMFDLSHENLGHFQLSCDNLENLHYHGQGLTNIFTADTQGIEEANPTGIDVGAKGVNIFGQQDRVEILQIAATGAISAEMERVEKRMVMLGAQVAQDQTNAQTATAKQIDSNASMSQLKRIAQNISSGLTWCSTEAAKFMGLSETVSVSVNDQFITDGLTAQDVQVMFSLYQAQAATLDELNEVKRKAGWTNKSNEELSEALDDEPVVAGESEEIAQLRMELDNAKSELEELKGNQ